MISRSNRKVTIFGKGMINEVVVCRMRSYMKNCGITTMCTPTWQSNSVTCQRCYHTAITVTVEESRDVSFSKKSYFVVMLHRKVNFKHNQAVFEVLCRFVSLPLLPRELRSAKLAMMPQQASVFHQPVLLNDGIHLDNDGVIHLSSSVKLKRRKN